jgi:hypothetical protein
MNNQDLLLKFEEEHGQLEPIQFLQFQHRLNDLQLGF